MTAFYTQTVAKYDMYHRIRLHVQQLEHFKPIKLMEIYMTTIIINSLNTKRRPLYLKTQFVPRSKHFSSRL